jgi:enamine deaminase RidA (YjgF/YER057c/UK114 family)
VDGGCQTIEEQASLTLENCREQFSTVGCKFNDVFKVKIRVKVLGEARDDGIQTLGKQVKA